ncbi:MAG: DUF308 domain-containing protein [Gluconobacter potus]|uniref:HdeD n=1 Tax=Gluconobacter potus TaxID=2724927 RepID=A0A149QU11_9PROT|nr:MULTISPECIES: DUF308 domain-containing protein [Gluconobacter]KXV00803.1 hdeD [Gluconobacter potus]MBF0865068.1 HdeD family acid-resistance protein [Gluconobacter sp. R71656]MBF0868223.1 HdeD family acid-resistance protein [Gluconobacter sp. R75628]MBF0874205.1 HdeD family acid-resistance protein [Gluconobacter sp. R75629]MBF0883182.1 HdeD family acid-resistance protein [Gluconobacter potus]
MSDSFNTIRFPSPQGLKPGWFIGFGAFLIILGILAALDTVATTLTSMVILGVLMIIGGVAQVMQSFAHRGLPVPNQWLSGLIGGLYIFGGLLLIEEPATGSIFLTAILAGCLIFAGLARTFWAGGHRNNRSWLALAISGLVTLIIGIMLYMTLPWSGLWLIGMFIAVELLMAGVATVLFGLSLRSNGV